MSNDTLFLVFESVELYELSFQQVRKSLKNRQTVIITNVNNRCKPKLFHNPKLPSTSLPSIICNTAFKFELLRSSEFNAEHA